jgi:hypothetical protein
VTLVGQGPEGALTIDNSEGPPSPHSPSPVTIRRLNSGRAQTRTGNCW